MKAKKEMKMAGQKMPGHKIVVNRIKERAEKEKVHNKSEEKAEL